MNYDEKAELLRESGFAPDWQKPIPFNDIRLPKFPVNELPPFISEYVTAVSESTQTSPDMAATAALAILALSVQGKFCIQGKADWKEPLNLYTTVIAPPGERKSAVMSHMSKPIRIFEKSENERLAPLIERNKMDKAILENRKKQAESAASKTPNYDKSELTRIAQALSEFVEIKPCRLYCDDITPEKLAGILSDCGGRTALLSTEGGIFDILAGRYSNSANIDVLLKAHISDEIRVDRQGRASEYIRDPALTILLFVQPNVIESLMSNGVFHGRGLCGRFLYSLPKSPIGSRTFDSRRIPEITTDKYNNLIFKLLSVPNEQSQLLTLTSNAVSHFRELYNMIEPMLLNELFDISDFSTKFVGTVLRIAGLLHLTNRAGTDNLDDLAVTENSMLSAISIGMYYLEHAKAAYQLMGADEDCAAAKYLLKRIDSIEQSEFTKRDLFQMCKGKFGKIEAMESALKILVEMEYIREVSVSTGGRPSVKIIVNPLHKSNKSLKRV